MLPSAFFSDRMVLYDAIFYIATVSECFHERSNPEKEIFYYKSCEKGPHALHKRGVKFRKSRCRFYCRNNK